VRAASAVVVCLAALDTLLDDITAAKTPAVSHRR